MLYKILIINKVVNINYSKYIIYYIIYKFFLNKFTRISFLYYL